MKFKFLGLGAILFICASLGACSSLRPLSPDAELSSVERVDDETILLTGTITRVTVVQFHKALTASTKKLLLDSVGGFSKSAIEIGHAVFDRGLDVEVTGRCFSACANYLFPAGRRKIIGEQGVLMWHGCGLYYSYMHQEKNGRGFSGKLKLEHDEHLALERILHKKLGQDEFICWFGMIPPHNSRYGYTLSKADMEKFGILGIEVRDNYPTVNSMFQNLKYRIMAPKLEVDWEHMATIRVKAYEISQGLGKETASP